MFDAGPDYWETREPVSGSRVRGPSNWSSVGHSNSQIAHGSQSWVSIVDLNVPIAVNINQVISTMMGQHALKSRYVDEMR